MTSKESANVTADQKDKTGLAPSIYGTYTAGSKDDSYTTGYWHDKSQAAKLVENRVLLCDINDNVYGRMLNEDAHLMTNIEKGSALNLVDIK